jgi:hypothetical protein
MTIAGLTDLRHSSIYVQLPASIDQKYAALCHGHLPQITYSAFILAPWELYLKARVRRSPPALQVEDEDDQEPDHIRSIRAMARSELRFAEIVRQNSNSLHDSCCSQFP